MANKYINKVPFEVFQSNPNIQQQVVKEIPKTPYNTGIFDQFVDILDYVQKMKDNTNKNIEAELDNVYTQGKNEFERALAENPKWVDDDAGKAWADGLWRDNVEARYNGYLEQQRAEGRVKDDQYVALKNKYSTKSYGDATTGYIRPAVEAEGKREIVRYMATKDGLIRGINDDVSRKLTSGEDLDLASIGQKGFMLKQLVDSGVVAKTPEERAMGYREAFVSMYNPIISSQVSYIMLDPKKSFVKYVDEFDDIGYVDTRAKARDLQDKYNSLHSAKTKEEMIATGVQMGMTREQADAAASEVLNTNFGLAEFNKLQKEIERERKEDDLKIVQSRGVLLDNIERGFKEGDPSAALMYGYGQNINQKDLYSDKPIKSMIDKGKETTISKAVYGIDSSVEFTSKGNFLQLPNGTFENVGQSLKRSESNLEVSKVLQNEFKRLKSANGNIGGEAALKELCYQEGVPYSMVQSAIKPAEQRTPVDNAVVDIYAISNQNKWDLRSESANDRMLTGLNDALAQRGNAKDLLLKRGLNVNQVNAIITYAGNYIENNKDKFKSGDDQKNMQYIDQYSWSDGYKASNVVQIINRNPELRSHLMEVIDGVKGMNKQIPGERAFMYGNELKNDARSNIYKRYKTSAEREAEERR